MIDDTERDALYGPPPPQRWWVSFLFEVAGQTVDSSLGVWVSAERPAYAVYTAIQYLYEHTPHRDTIATMADLTQHGGAVYMDVERLTEDIHHTECQILFNGVKAPLKAMVWCQETAPVRTPPEGCSRGASTSCDCDRLLLL